MHAAEEMMDGPNQAAEKGGAPKLAERVKELRTAKKMSLNQLAEASGLARSTLYKVENNGMSLTYDKLLSLSVGLGVEIAELFQHSGRGAELPAFAGRREIGRNGDGDSITTPNYEYLYLCNELVQKDLIPMIGILKTRTMEEYGALLGHPGQEFIYVLDGAVEVVTQLYRPTILRKGDFIYLDSPMPHAYLCVSKEPAKILAVCSTPEHSHGIAQVDSQIPAKAAPPQPSKLVSKNRSHAQTSRRSRR